VPHRKISEMQSDHKSWLKDIDRWEFYLRNWSNEHQELLDGFARFKQRVEQYGRDLKSHAEAIQKHKGEILACERMMVERHPGADDADQPLAESHAKDADLHQAQHVLHEQLKKVHHTFLAQLGMLRHSPNRED
jgi:hypothetical protein